MNNRQTAKRKHPKDYKTQKHRGCTCDWCCPLEKPRNKRRRIAADEQIAETSQDAVAAIAIEDQEHADDKRQLNELGHRLHCDSVTVDDDPIDWQDERESREYRG